MWGVFSPALERKLFSKNGAFLYSWVSWHHSRGDMKQSKHGGKLWRLVPIASPRLPSILFSQVTLVIVWVIRGKLSKIQNNTYAVESFNTIHTCPVLFYITYDLSATHILFFYLNCKMIPSYATALRVLPLVETFAGTFISSSLSLHHVFEPFCGSYLPPSLLSLYLNFSDYPPQCIPCTDGLFLVSKLPYIFHAKHIKHISQDVKLRPCYEKEHVAFVLGGLCNLTKYAVFQFRPFTWQLHDFAFLFRWVILLSLCIPQFHYLLDNW